MIYTMPSTRIQKGEPMISELQRTACQPGEGRSEQRTKYKNVEKTPKGYRQVFESFIKKAFISGLNP